MTQKSSILGSGRRSRAGKRGSSNAEATVRRGVAPAMSVGASPGQGLGTWARSGIAEATAARLTEPGGPPTAAGITAASPTGACVGAEGRSGRLGTLLPGASRKLALSMHLPASSATKQLHVHRQRALCFFLFCLWPQFLQKAVTQIASEIGSHERTCLVVKAVPGWPVSIPECR